MESSSERESSPESDGTHQQIEEPEEESLSYEHQGSDQEAGEETSPYEDEDQAMDQESAEQASLSAEEDEEVNEEPEEESPSYMDEEQGNDQEAGEETSPDVDEDQAMDQESDEQASPSAEEDVEVNKELEEEPDSGAEEAQQIDSAGEEKTVLLPEMTLYRLDLEKIISKGGEKFDAAKHNKGFEYGRSLCKNVIDFYNGRQNNAGGNSSSNGRGEENEGEQAADVVVAQHNNEEASNSQNSITDNSELDSQEIQDPMNDPILERGEEYLNCKSDKKVLNSMVIGYKQRKSRNNELVEALSKLGLLENEGKTHTVSVILFIIMGSKESPSIYALTNNYAHLVVRDFCDDRFSFKIAQRSMDPKIDEMGNRHLVGKLYARNLRYRQAGVPIHMSGNDLVNRLKSRFKVGSAILSANQSLKLKSEKGARVDVTTKSVHICKRQSLEQFVDVIQYMENLYENGEEEEDEELAFLDYIKLVKDKKKKEELEDQLVVMIWKDITARRGVEERPNKRGQESQYDSGISVDNSLLTQAGNTSDQQDKETPIKANMHGHIDFCYRDYEKYHTGAKFTIVKKGRKSKETPVMWDEPKSYEEVLEELDNAFKDKTSLDSFSKDIKQRELKFTVQDPDADKQNKLQDRLLNFFHTECQVGGQHYFKLDAEWLKVDVQYIKQVHKDFENLLKQKLRDESSEIHLPEKWKWNAYDKFRKLHLTQITQAEKEVVQSIWKLFVDNKLVHNDEVKRSELEKFLEKGSTFSQDLRKVVGEFLSKTDIKTMKEGEYNEMYSFLDGKTKFCFSDLEKITPKEEIVDSIWTLLAKNKLVDQYAKVKRSDLRESLEKGSKFSKEQTEVIRKLLKESKWFVGDRILLSRIELFDIMQVAKNGEDLYLYHVKESFGQSTRDACSQIRVSAHFLRSAINSETDESLKKYFEKIVHYEPKEENGKKKNTDDQHYREEEKKKVKYFGDVEEFIKLFKRRITYVYAFLNTQQKEANIIDIIGKTVDEDSKNKRDRKERSYESNIARVELLGLNLTLEELGFQLAICQIKRQDTVDSDSESHVCQENGDIHMRDSHSSPLSSPNATMGELRSPPKKKTKSLQQTDTGKKGQQNLNFGSSTQ